ncbi:MAG: hypothetical protein JWQ36_858 [Enterovirga sp.]|jgi:hypothetical protein|nr:hypothetical protein [Enterovirga sp.]
MDPGEFLNLPRRKPGRINGADEKGQERARS